MALSPKCGRTRYPSIDAAMSAAITSTFNHSRPMSFRPEYCSRCSGYHLRRLAGNPGWLFDRPCLICGRRCETGEQAANVHETPEGWAHAACWAEHLRQLVIEDAIVQPDEPAAAGLEVR